MKIVIDKEFERLVPPLSANELKGLETDIVERGKCLDSIKIWQPDKSRDKHLICDGRNWLCNCRKLSQKKPSNTEIVLLD